MQHLNIDPYVMIAEEVYDVLLRIESNLKKNIFSNSYSNTWNILNKGTYSIKGHMCISYIFMGFPGGSVGKESICIVGDLGSVFGLGRSPREGKAQFSSVQFSSVTQSCPTLCDPMNRRMPGFPVHHHLPEFTQTHVHQVSDANYISIKME